MNVQSVLSILVIFLAVPLNWYLAVSLWLLARLAPDSRALVELALMATHLAIVITVFAAVFLNNGMETPLLNLEQTQLLTRSAILSLVIPPLRWLFLYRNGRQR